MNSPAATPAPHAICPVTSELTPSDVIRRAVLYLANRCDGARTDEAIDALLEQKHERIVLG